MTFLHPDPQSAAKAAHGASGTDTNCDTVTIDTWAIAPQAFMACPPSILNVYSIQSMFPWSPP